MATSAHGYVPRGLTLRAFLDAFGCALIGPPFGGRKICCAQDIYDRSRKLHGQAHWRFLIVTPDSGCWSVRN
jgi:hypothetical protein